MNGSERSTEGSMFGNPWQSRRAPEPSDLRSDGCSGNLFGNLLGTTGQNGLSRIRRCHPT